MFIGTAIEAMKKGSIVALAHDTDRIFYYVEANSYPASNNLLKVMEGKYDNDLVPYQAYLAVKDGNNGVTQWTPTQEELLSEEYSVLEWNVRGNQDSIDILNIIHDTEHVMDEKGFGYFLGNAYKYGNCADDGVTDRADENGCNSHEDLLKLTFEAFGVTASYLHTSCDDDYYSAVAVQYIDPFRGMYTQWLSETEGC